MDKLTIAKEIIRNNIDRAEYGIFNTRNLVGDPMINLYYSKDLIVDICSYYGYFEVFKLNDDEFSELEKYYRSLLKERE